MASIKEAIFIRKPVNLAAVNEDTRQIRAIFQNPKGDRYYIAEVRRLTASEWAEFTRDLLADQEWIEKFSKRDYPMIEGAAPCIHVSSYGCGPAVIVNTEGYTYARYVAIENE